MGENQYGNVISSYFSVFWFFPVLLLCFPLLCDSRVNPCPSHPRFPEGQGFPPSLPLHLLFMQPRELCFPSPPSLPSFYLSPPPPYISAQTSSLPRPSLITAPRPAFRRVYSRSLLLPWLSSHHVCVLVYGGEGVRL